MKLSDAPPNTLLLMDTKISIGESPANKLVSTRTVLGFKVLCDSELIFIDICNIKRCNIHPSSEVELIDVNFDVLRSTILKLLF